MYKKTKNPGAWICSNENDHQNRGRLKIHQPGSKIYLQNGDEFEIELYNPTTNNVKAEIKIDGKPICSGGLVIRSGERIYLECFPDSRKKFTFKTYNVDDSEETKKAISNNGRVDVLFYKEKITQIYCNPIPWNTSIYGGVYNNYYNDIQFMTTNLCNVGSTLANSTPSSSNLLNLTRSTKSKSIETGQVDGGLQSDQQFMKVDMEFECLSYNSYSFQILPLSQKPISKKAFKVKRSKESLKTSDKLDNLLKLGELHKNGTISDTEFMKLKAEMI